MDSIWSMALAKAMESGFLVSGQVTSVLWNIWDVETISIGERDRMRLTAVSGDLLPSMQPASVLDIFPRTGTGTVSGCSLLQVGLERHLSTLTLWVAERTGN